MKPVQPLLPFVLALILLPLAHAGPWIASPEVKQRADASPERVSGIVFHDLNGDGRHQEGEPGVTAVKVSNGLEVTLTETDGRYVLPVRPDMDLTVVQPAGWEVPVDERMVPRFFYVHKEHGTPEQLRYGGLPPTGPMPGTVNFPLRPSETDTRFRAAVIGDSQTYSNQEVSYYRDSAVRDIINLDGPAPAFMLYLGDVVGDDIGLLDRLLRVGSAAGIPQWLAHGNHDVDFDATSDDDSADSWRRVYGPNYYAFEEGNALFVVLDNVVYPCGEADRKRPDRDFCGDADNPTYNGRVPHRQMAWLENLLALTPPDRIVVFAHHIPFVSFVDPSSSKHQTDNLPEIYKLVEGRDALSLSGHTHTMENHAPGQKFDGWEEAVGIEHLAFRHIIAGAASGSWYHGDLNYRGIPMSFQRMGSPKGVLILDFDGNHYSERYLGGGVPADMTMWVSLNTPRFRGWYTALMEWRDRPREERGEEDIPPFSINDLGDNRLLVPADLEKGVWLTANVWAGSAGSRVTVSLNGSEPLPMQRTQSGTGERIRIGAEWADPFAAQRQLSVARFALQSTSGNKRNQGYEAFRGSRFGPASPQPMRNVADRNMHLWRWKLPAGLPPGVHTATITNTDRNGYASEQTLAFEVTEILPPLRWRREPWQE